MILKHKARFEKAFRGLSANDQRHVVETVEQLDRFFTTREAPEGLGLKKLFSQESMGAVCEARATLALRIIFAVQRETITLLMVGDHNEVRRFIHSFQ